MHFKNILNWFCVLFSKYVKWTRNHACTENDNSDCETTAQINRNITFLDGVGTGMCLTA